MDETLTAIFEGLGRGAWSIIPLTLIAWLVVRGLPCRPATRHVLWAAVLAWAVLAPLFPAPPASDSVAVAPVVEEVRAPLAAMESEGGTQRSSPARSAHAGVPENFTFAGAARPRARAAPDASAPPRRADGTAASPERAAKEPADAPHANNRRPVNGSTEKFRAADGADSGSPFPTEPAASHPTAFAPVSAPSLRVPIPPVADDEEVATAKWSPQELKHASSAPPEKSAYSAALDSAWVVWSGLRRWYGHVGMAVFSAPVGVSMMPTGVWAVGMLMIFAATLARLARGRSLLRSSSPAPPTVRLEVRAVAHALGLAQAPETRMVEAAVSPMILCGGRARLLLPVALWEQLDEIGRRAVLCHELAHVKRRDHWMLWLDRLAGTIYWWHPAVWWARRRVAEEADRCCDAWVTWLLPRGRRAYAEALLRTTQFVRDRAEAAPAWGVGVVSGRAERVTRRIKMVMTESTRPQRSGAGVLLALTLMACGWLAVPAKSCPKGGPEAASTGAPGKCSKATCASGCGKGKAASAAASPTSDGGTAMLARSGGDSPPPPPPPVDRALEERMNKLEADLERIARQLERIGEPTGDGEAPRERAPDRERRRRGSAPRLTVVPPPGEGAPEPPPPPATGEPLLPPPPGAAGGPGPGVALAPRPPAAPGGPDEPVVVRAYHLPPGKLAALSKLMGREDVPIRVRPLEDRLEVEATERHQALFKGFVDLISDRKQVREYAVSPGKRGDLYALMARSDVPLLVEPGREGIRVHGSSLEHAVFKAFLEMIEPGADHREAPGEAGVEESREPRPPRPPRVPRGARPPRPENRTGAALPLDLCRENPEACRELEMRMAQAARELEAGILREPRGSEEARMMLRERELFDRLRETRDRERLFAEGAARELFEGSAAAAAPAHEAEAALLRQRALEAAGEAQRLDAEVRALSALRADMEARAAVERGRSLQEQERARREAEEALRHLEESDEMSKEAEELGDEAAEP